MTQRYYGPNWERSSGQALIEPAQMPPPSPAHWTQEPQEDMKHPDNVWTELSNSEYPLPVLLETYIRHLGGRTKPASPATIDKYKRTLNHFMKSLELNGDQAILANVTPFTVERWVG